MEKLRKYRIAVVQMDSQNNKPENLNVACRCIDEAVCGRM